MKKYIFILSVIIGFVSCNFGVWNNTGTYHTFRPKHPNYSILTKPFNRNELIDTNSFYISIQKFFYDGVYYVGCLGFYNNGQMINTSGKETEIQTVMKETNSFRTALRVGYYTTKGNKITFEYFIPGDGGQYLTREGIIKKDTIILSETTRYLHGKETISDTFVKSNFLLK